jgi:DNA processing protein
MNKTDIFALSLIKGLGKKSLFNIISSGLSISELRSLDENELGNYIMGSGKVNAINSIHELFEHYQEKAETEIGNLNDNDIQFIAFSDEEFPFLYKIIPDPPIFLYVKGNHELLNYRKGIAVVGTRECSDIGRNVAFNTAKYFAENDFNIVSGLALGIDTAGHKGALEAHGKTTSIVTDVQNIYPEENIQLSEDILNQDGLLISENPPGTFPHRGLFVSRDRLQSGLSLAVFPIETDIKGGTMHTVQFAQDQNRLLFCPDLLSIPKYPNNFSKSRGVIQLINDGKAIAFNKSIYSEVLDKLKKHEVFLWDNISENQSNEPGQLKLDGI